MNQSIKSSVLESRDRQAPAYRSGDVREIDSDDEPRLAEYRDILIDHRWPIAGVLAFMLVASLLYVVLATPVYRAKK